MTKSTTRTGTASITSIASIRNEPVQRRSADRIASLLDTAARLIDDSGIDGVTTSDVAAASGSSVGVVYRYFPNIQSLLHELAERNLRRFSDRVFGSRAAAAGDWTVVLDRAIDAYVDLARNEPGFRALGFGDVIAKRFIHVDAGYSAVLAREFNQLLVKECGLAPSEELTFDLEVIAEIGDALLTRAFRYDRHGDPRFIAKLRAIVTETIATHAGHLAGR